MKNHIRDNELEHIFDRLDQLVAQFNDRLASISITLDDDKFLTLGILTENMKKMVSDVLNSYELDELHKASQKFSESLTMKERLDEFLIRLDRKRQAEDELLKFFENDAHNQDHINKINLEIIQLLHEIQNECDKAFSRIHEILLSKLQVIKSEIYNTIKDVLSDLCEQAEQGNLSGLLMANKDQFVRDVKNLSSQLSGLNSSEISLKMAEIENKYIDVNSQKISGRDQKFREIDNQLLKLADAEYVEVVIKKDGSKFIVNESNETSLTKTIEFLKNESSILNKSTANSTSKVNNSLRLTSLINQNGSINQTVPDSKLYKPIKAERKKLNLDTEPDSSPDPDDTPTKKFRR